MRSREYVSWVHTRCTTSAMCIYLKWCVGGSGGTHTHTQTVPPSLTRKHKALLSDGGVKMCRCMYVMAHLFICCVFYGQTPPLHPKKLPSYRCVFFISISSVFCIIVFLILLLVCHAYTHNLRAPMWVCVCVNAHKQTDDTGITQHSHNTAQEQHTSLMCTYSM
jgi:hypothetical protein